jgi:hypothetical protein
MLGSSRLEHCHKAAVSQSGAGLWLSQQGARHQTGLMQGAAEPRLCRDPERPLKAVSQVIRLSGTEVASGGAPSAQVEPACSGRCLAAGADTWHCRLGTAAARMFCNSRCETFFHC